MALGVEQMASLALACRGAWDSYSGASLPPEVREFINGLEGIDAIDRKGQTHTTEDA